MFDLSKHPALSVERLLVFTALGYYLYRQVQLQKSGTLAGEDSWMVKVDKEKMFDMAASKFKLNPFQRTMMEQAFGKIMASDEREP